MGFWVIGFLMGFWVSKNQKPSGELGFWVFPTDIYRIPDILWSMVYKKPSKTQKPTGFLVVGNWVFYSFHRKNPITQ